MSGVRLNRKVTLEGRIRAEDGAGGFTDSWGAVCTLWAEVASRGGRLVRGETGESSVGRFRVTVRAAPPGHSNRPLPGQRFDLAGRILRIEAVTERDPDALYLRCDCEEEVNS